MFVIPVIQRMFVLLCLCQLVLLRWLVAVGVGNGLSPPELHDFRIRGMRTRTTSAQSSIATS